MKARMKEINPHPALRIFEAKGKTRAAIHEEFARYRRETEEYDKKATRERAWMRTKHEENVRAIMEAEQ